jgi:hypothetical protein
MSYDQDSCQPGIWHYINWYRHQFQEFVVRARLNPPTLASREVAMNERVQEKWPRADGDISSATKIEKFLEKIYQGVKAFRQSQVTFCLFH